jgi:hypothetical protein
MKAVKILAILVLIYAGIVTAFESMIGYRQPESEGTIVLTTFDADGTAHERVVSRLETGGQTYVAANHWPRAWYRRVLENPEVRVSKDGEISDQRAVPVTDEEHERVDADHPRGTVFRVLTGFPPRRFVRLEPR